jgi:ABC-type glycerol-3-phosphate transport system substrate-binding protein
MSMKITRRVALSQAAGAGLLAACGGSRQAKTPALPAVTFDQPVAITFFHSQNAANGKALQDMVDKVNQSKESLDDIFPAYLEGLRFPQYGNQLLSFPFT